MDDSYELKEHRKLVALIEAALMNMATSGGEKIRIETCGHNPHSSITIEAYILKKFIKELS